MSKSLSSRALDALLKEDSELAQRVKTSGIHRTLLSRYRHAHCKPDASTIARLDRLTDGRVPANGWEDEPKESEGSDAA